MAYLIERQTLQMGALQALKAHLKDNQVDLTNDNITSASSVTLNGESFELDTPTEFVVDGEAIPLRLVIFCWINKDVGTTQFLEDCASQGFKVLGFLQRNDLINWLAGSGESEYIKQDDSAVTTTSVDNKASVEQDPFLVKVLQNERDLVGHNGSLDGFKQVDFRSVSRECEIKIIKTLKRNKPTPATANPAKKQQTSSSNSKPIILISPAASSLITLANIKQFLEHSNYIFPTTRDPAEQELLSNANASMCNVTHHFPRLNRTVTFLVTNNTTLFTKPEYWDRVIAVFTTGQEWQFKNYKWSNPRELFQRVKGFYFYFKGDSIQGPVKDWNVEKVAVDRSLRFKDAEVLNGVWDALEKKLVSSGK